MGLLLRTKAFFKRRRKWWQGLTRKRKALYIASTDCGIFDHHPDCYVSYYYNDIGNIDRLLNRNNTGVVLKDTKGKVFFSTGRAEHRELVPLDKISDNDQKRPDCKRR